MSESAREMDVVVLGGGISGLVGTSVLLEQQAGSVLVIDDYPQAGGNHKDVAIDGYTFDVGSFIFQDDSPLLAHFPELLPQYVAIDPTWSRLNPQQKVTEYPFSVRDDIAAAGPAGALRIAGSALVARANRRPFRHAQDFAQHWVGRRFLHRSGLGSYMERFCGCPLAQIDLAFAESRMMWMKEQTQLSTVLRRLLAMTRRTEAFPTTNTQLARPRSGFGDLYAPTVARLEERGAQFAFSHRLCAIRRVGQRFEIETDRGTFTAKRVLCTIPVSLAADLCGISADPLPTVTLLSLFYSFSGRRGFSSSILYNFSHQARWKRLTVYSDFYGRHQDREYFAVEVVAAADGSTTTDTAAAEFRQHTADNSLLDGDLRLEGSHVLTQAYPVYSRGSAETAAALVRQLRAFGIESFGRQGSFEYQPTARVSTQVAESALSKAQ